MAQKHIRSFDGNDINIFFNNKRITKIVSNDKDKARFWTKVAPYYGNKNTISYMEEIYCYNNVRTWNKMLHRFCDDSMTKDKSILKFIANHIDPYISQFITEDMIKRDYASIFSGYCQKEILPYYSLQTLIDLIDNGSISIDLLIFSNVKIPLDIFLLKCPKLNLYISKFTIMEILKTQKIYPRIIIEHLSEFNKIFSLKENIEILDNLYYNDNYIKDLKTLILL